MTTDRAVEATRADRTGDDDEVNPPAPTRRRRAVPAARSLTWAGAVVASLAVVVLHLRAGLAVHGPVWSDDEIGILANARVIAGVGEPYDLAHLSYYPGWSIVLAPLWWITTDPLEVYRYAVLLSSLAGIATMLPLTALARRIGLSLPLAVIAAAVVVVNPARTVMSTYALTEGALVLVVSLTLAAAVRFAASRRAVDAALLGVASAASFVVHGRMVALLGMTLVWFAVEVLRRRRVGLVGLVSTIVPAVLGFLLHVRVSTLLYGSEGSREGSAVRILLGADVEAVLRSGVGQLWYGMAAWVVLPVIGLGLVLWACREELRRREPAVGWWGLGVITATTLVSTVSASAAIARGSNRLDIVAYGRYLDPVVTPLALLGVALLLRQVVRVRHLAVVVGVSVVLAAVFLLLIVPAAPRGGWWAPINLAGLLGRSWPPPGDPGPAPWLVLSLTAVAGAVAYLVLRRWPLLPVAGLLVYFAASSVLAQERLVLEYNEALGAPPDLVAVIEELDPDELSFDTIRADWAAQNLYQYWLTGRTVHVFTSWRESPPTDLVIARDEWGRGERAGARVVSGSHRDDTLWVMPGPLADELEAAGMLESEDPERPLRSYAHDVDRLDADEDAPLEVSEDGTAELELRVTNEGRQSWTVLGTTDTAVGNVRVILGWPTRDGVQTQLVELPRTVLPGASVDLDVTLQVPDGAVDGTVSVALVHEGVRQFTPPSRPALTIPLDVPPID